MRVDTGVEQGDEITPYYDPMIAKLIVWDQTRDRALARMLQALAQYRIVGVANNVEFLSRLVACPAFARADLDTGLIERERDVPVPAAKAMRPTRRISSPRWPRCCARTSARAPRPAPSGDPHSPWRLPDGWRLNSRAERRLVFRYGEASARSSCGYGDGGYRAGARRPCRARARRARSQRHAARRARGPAPRRERDRRRREAPRVPGRPQLPARARRSAAPGRRRAGRGRRPRRADAGQGDRVARAARHRRRERRAAADPRSDEDGAHDHRARRRDARRRSASPSASR